MLARSLLKRTLRAPSRFSTARAFTSLPTSVQNRGNELVNQQEADMFNSADNTIEKYQLPAAEVDDKSRRNFIYFLSGGNKLMAGSIARLAVMKIVASLSASADVLALSATEVDLSGISEGSNMTVKFRGKPVFVRHRSAAEIAQAQAVDVSELRDPETDDVRVEKPKWLVVLGVCTHLGCVPIANAGQYNGYFCPCHGSHYDISGRIRKGPAPFNLEIPQYSFVGEDKLIIG